MRADIGHLHMCRRILGPAPLEVDGIARAVGVYARAEEYDWGDAQADEDACPVVEDLIRKLDMERCYRRSEEAKWQDTEQQLRQQVQDLESERQLLLQRVQNSVHSDQIAAMQVPSVFCARVSYEGWS